MKPIVVLIAAAVLASACDVKNPTGPQFGAVAGTIASTAGAPLVNVKISLSSGTYGDSTRSDAHGAWSIGHVPIGVGTVLLDSLSLPAGCASVPPFSYGVQQGGKTTRITLTVPC